jgi:hypothetical protein
VPGAPGLIEVVFDSEGMRMILLRRVDDASS